MAWINEADGGKVDTKVLGISSQVIYPKKGIMSSKLILIDTCPWVIILSLTEHFLMQIGIGILFFKQPKLPNDLYLNFQIH